MSGCERLAGNGAAAGNLRLAGAAAAAVQGGLLVKEGGQEKCRKPATRRIGYASGIARDQCSIGR